MADFFHLRSFSFLFALALGMFSWPEVLGTPPTPPDPREAPALQQKVQRGELPPMEDRLPVHPRVIEPVEQIGRYGGTLRSALLGGSDQNWLERTFGYEHLLVYNREYDAVIPNVARKYTVNEDATEFTFYLREGMRWSDGHPFTADDILFWYEDVLMNEALTPAVPAWLRAGGEPVVVEKIDDTTVVFRFAAPKVFFPDHLAQAGGWPPTFHPKHYLSQFHIRYNPENIDRLVREANTFDWTGLFLMKGGTGANRYNNPDHPNLLPWRLTQPYDGTRTRVRAERNPYYFKIDTEGNQLPYIDEVIYEVLGDEEVMLLKTVGGELDLAARHINTVDNRPVLYDYRKRAGYRFFTATQTGMNLMSLNLNLNHQNPVKREVFQNKKFRIGISHAINRGEIIDLVYVGQGEPWQMAPQPTGPFHHERLARQYTEYDPALANHYLDRAGYTRRDRRGYRLGPDGRRIVIIAETFDRRPWIDALELIRIHLGRVGIDFQVRVVDPSLYAVRADAGQHDAVAWWSAGGVRNLILEPFFKFPFIDGQSRYAPQWALWYQTNGAQGEKPPEITRHQMELYDRILTTADPEERHAMMMEIIEIAADQFYVLGISRSIDDYGIASNRLRNLPERVPGIPALWPAQANPEQFFLLPESR